MPGTNYSIRPQMRSTRRSVLRTRIAQVHSTPVTMMSADDVVACSWMTIWELESRGLLEKGQVSVGPYGSLTVAAAQEGEDGIDESSDDDDSEMMGGSDEDDEDDEDEEAVIPVPQGLRDMLLEEYKQGKNRGFSHTSRFYRLLKGEDVDGEEGLHLSRLRELLRYLVDHLTRGTKELERLHHVLSNDGKLPSLYSLAYFMATLQDFEELSSTMKAATALAEGLPETAPVLNMLLETQFITPNEAALKKLNMAMKAVDMRLGAVQK